MICSLRVGDVECDAQRRVPLLTFGESLPMAFLCRVRYEINLCGVKRCSMTTVPTEKSVSLSFQTLSNIERFLKDKNDVGLWS
jgi:hypothetical protein